MLKYLNRSLAVLFLASLLVAIAGCAVPASAQGGAPPVTNIQLRNGPELRRGGHLVGCCASGDALSHRLRQYGGRLPP